VTTQTDGLSLEELTEAWPALSDDERIQGFVILTPEEGEEFLSHLPAHDAVDLISALPKDARRKWLRLLPPDDVTDIIQEAEEADQAGILALLDEPARKEAAALLEYDEDDAGGLMTPRFTKLRANMTAAQAIDHLRQQASRNAELIYYAYVLDDAGRLVGVVSFRELVKTPAERRIADIMTTDLVTVPDTMDQEAVSHIFAHHDLYCLPVVDAQGHIKGIVTADDIVDVVHEEATEDMHKLGGSEALESPYLQAGLWEMLKKRAVWLVALLVAECMTIEVISRYQSNLRADLAVLVLFIPLIVSCGGNSGSQAATFVVRAMALDECRLRDWWRVVRRELLTAASLGAVLGVTGLIATAAWNFLWARVGGVPRLGESPVTVSVAVGISIVCVVLWGTMVGTLLPFVLRRVGADPASASAPLVATIVDATGLVIYFTVGGLVLTNL
jgi:magnesium transporter